VSEEQRNHLEELKQEQGRLEELLFLIDPKRRPRVQKMLAYLRAQISAVTTGHASEPPVVLSLEQLRQRQSDLEASLFDEPPEQRPSIKKLLAQVRADIARAEIAQASELGSQANNNNEEAKPGGPQVA
jgi:hypothetical protein